MDANTSNFKSASEKLLKKVNRNLKFNQLSLNLFNRLLNRLINKIFRQLSDQYGNQLNDVTWRDVENALENLMSKSVKKHAIAQGTNILILFQSGLLNYRAKHKGVRIDYRKGIDGILKEINSDLTLSESSMELIEWMLNRVLNKVRTELNRTQGGRTTFSITDIENALGGDGNNNVRIFARNEGVRVLTLYESGLIKFRFINRGGTNYKRGLDLILKMTHANQKIRFKQDSWMLLSRILEIFTTRVFQSLCRENAYVEIYGNSGDISPDFLKNTLKDRITPIMMHHANSEGMKALSLYESGFLKYKAEMNFGLITQKDFSKNISSSVHSFITKIFDKFTCDTNVEKEICMILEKLLKTIIITTHRQSSGREHISLHEVSRSIEEIFGENLTSHAKSEGMKAVTLANCELLVQSEEKTSPEKSKEKIKRRRKSSKKVSAKRRKKTIEIKKPPVRRKRARISGSTIKKKSAIPKPKIKIAVRTKAKRQQVIKRSTKPRKRKVSKKSSRRKTTPRKKPRKTTKKSSKRKTSTKRKTPSKKKKSTDKRTPRKQGLKRKVSRRSSQITKKVRSELSLKKFMGDAEQIFRPQLEFVADAMKISYDKEAFSAICRKLITVAVSLAREVHKQTSPLTYVSIINALRYVYPKSLLKHAEADGLRTLNNNLHGMSR